MYKWLAIMVFVIALLNLVLLAFAYRDFSYALIAMFFLTALGLPVATAMLLQLWEKNSILRFTPGEEGTEKLHDVWIEENDEEFNLKGRFCINE
tara:strand:- start:1792 stop:2073 length:282 start_codon:yes stop_codon:yes gene_type:complete